MKSAGNNSGWQTELQAAPRAPHELHTEMPHTPTFLQVAVQLQQLPCPLQLGQQLTAAPPQHRAPTGG